MVTEQLVKERSILVAFLDDVHRIGIEAGLYWGTVHSGDYTDFSTLKVVLVESSKVSYNNLEDFCVENNIVGFQKCKEGKGFIKFYLK